MVVFSALAMEFVEQSILKGDMKNRNVMSVIAMRDTGEIVIDREPGTMVLFNKRVDLRNTSRSSNHSKSLVMAENSLAKSLLADNNDSTRCAIRLLFISDGKPSDQVKRQIPNIFSEIKNIVLRFHENLTVLIMGFAGKNQDFSITRRMNDEVNSAVGSCSFITNCK